MRLLRQLLPKFIIVLILGLCLRLPVEAAGLNTYSSVYDGTTSKRYFAIADGSFFEITTDITIEGWVKLASVPSSFEYDLCAKYNSTGDNRTFLFGLENDTGNAFLKFGMSGNGITTNLTRLSYGSGWSINTWYHVAVTYDLSLGAVELFVNGTSIGTGSGETSFFNGTAEFSVGRRQLNDAHMNGQIDDLRFWTTLRTGTQINNSKSTEIDTATDLKGSWHFDDGSGDATDSSGNGYTLTNFNTVGYSTDVAFVGSSGVTPAVLNESFIMEEE